MNIKQFNQDQSRVLAAQFMDRLGHQCASRLSHEGLGYLLKANEYFFKDPLYPEVWKETYQNTFGRTLSTQTFLTPEEVFTTLIEFCLRFVFEWDIDLSETVRLLFKMRFRAKEYEPELAIWQELASQPLEEAPQPKTLSFFRVSAYSKKIKLDDAEFSEYEGYALMISYLERLWEQYRYLFVEDGAAGLGGLLTDFDLDQAAPFDWCHAYERSFGKVFSNDVLLTEEEVYTCIIDYVGQYWYGWTHNLREGFNLLLLIRHKPDNYELEWNIWREEVNNILTESNDQG